ncbi:MAG TPA: hybrid sensor histidine kinase/response regulator [Porphyromonadaceae bacterium]|nr:hybrid sensor histidine kinase/response regulator [Porphyromonadaceae bacterium]
MALNHYQIKIYFIFVGNRYILNLCCLRFLLFSLLLGFLVSCQHGNDTLSVYSSTDRKLTDSMVWANRSIDSLEVLLDRFVVDENKLGIMIGQRELGKLYRENNRFDDAIETSLNGLKVARELEDTLEIIQALNNTGTNFRRIGALEEASSYHYEALEYCETYSDKTSPAAIKNRNVTLNGIGNIQLTLGNNEAAEKVFREALLGEQKVDSSVGQAINYANIGATFESGGMVDSARYYYSQSMEYNRKAKSNLGISLCHNHFGRLYEKEKKWDKALLEYQSAYDIMKYSTDKWHWLESCLALARTYFFTGDKPNANKYLTEAHETATDIKSLEHLSEVYKLNYQILERQGNFREALRNYQLFHLYADSLLNTKNYIHLQNTIVKFERKKRDLDIATVSKNYERKRRFTQSLIYSATGLIVISLIALLALLYALKMRTKNQRMLQKTEKIRTNFFTNITHEFRTPLTVILGLGEQLESGQLKKEREIMAAGSVIMRQGNSFLELINQLLDISRIQSTIGKADWRTGNVVILIQMLVESFEMQARNQNIDLRFVTAETTVIMDFVPHYVKKMMCNLIANALKYTPEGGKVYISSRRKNNEIEIRVVDTGCGIHPEDLPNIFKPFFQGENSRMPTSSGVGLSLVHQIVKAMSGNITVVTALDKGSAFTLVLPLRHGTEKWATWIPPEIMTACRKQRNTPQLVETPDHHAVEDNSKETVLIAEDNSDVLFYIGSQFGKKYHLLFAKDGEEAFEKAENFIPDLIITDIRMPVMDGYELCRKIRASELVNHIPVIILTAKGNEEDRIKGIEAGAEAYLTKPFNSEELNVLAVKLLEIRKVLREKFSQALNEGTEANIQLTTAQQNFLTKLTDMVYAQMIKGEIDVENLASNMAMSRSQLNRKMIAITGYNISNYILRIRMSKAKRLLDADILTPIGEIALECGFTDMGYFSRTFKHLFHMTPSQYRKRVR